MRGRLIGLLTAVLALVAGGWVILGGGGDRGERGDDVRREAPATTNEPPVVLRGREEAPAAAAPTESTEPSAAKPVTGVVVVTVVADGDLPLSGAAVTIRRGPGAKGIGPVETGRDGTARVEGVPVGEFFARATLAHFQDGNEVGTLSAGSPAAVRIVLTPFVPIDGRVLFASGAPAAAQVVATKGGMYGGFSETCNGSWCRVAETTSAADGTFRVEVPPGQIVTITASLAGYAQATAYARRLGPGEEVVLRLAAAGTVRGVVRAPDGSPCAGADVFVVPADKAIFLSNPRAVIGPGGQISWSTVDEEDEGASITMSSGDEPVAEGPTLRAVRGKTGPDGTYEVSGLTLPGSYRTLAEGCEGSRGRSQDVALDDATRNAVADVPLRPRTVLVVRYEKADGTPATGSVTASLRGATDDFLQPKGEGSVNAHGAWKGAARFSGLVAGTYVLHVEMQDSLPQDQEVTVPERGTVEVVVKAVPGKTLRGRIVDAAGQPVADTWVSFDIAAGGDVVEQRAQASVGKDGTFTIGGLQDAAGRLAVGARSHAPWERSDVRPGDEEVHIVLRGLPTVHGRLVPAAGHALPAWVQVVVHDGRSASFGDGAKTDADGRFTVYVRTLGEPVFVVLLFGEAAPVLLGRFTLAAEETKDVGDVPIDDGRTLRGRVVDVEGKGVSGVTVWADMADLPDIADGFESQRWEVAVDAEGRFTLPRMPRTPVVLRTAHAPFAASWTPEAPGDTEIVLARAARIAGRVLDAQGKPRQAWFTLRRVEGDAVKRRDVEVYSDVDGALTSTLLAPGTYDVLWIPGADKRQTVGRVTLAPGETKTVEWRLP